MPNYFAKIQSEDFEQPPLNISKEPKITQNGDGITYTADGAIDSWYCKAKYYKYLNLLRHFLGVFK